MNLSKIRNLVQLRKVSLKKLASDIEMTEQNLHKRLNANDIMSSDLEKIARVLQVSVTEFFDEDVVCASHEEIVETHGPNSPAMHDGKMRVAIGADTSVETLRRENELLRQSLADKEEIINLLKEKK